MSNMSTMSNMPAQRSFLSSDAGRRLLLRLALRLTETGPAKGDLFAAEIAGHRCAPYPLDLRERHDFGG